MEVVEPETVPGGATDPLWYLIAEGAAPRLNTTSRARWIEGFVAALEIARGIDGEPGVGDVLRSSIGLSVEVPVAVRKPTPIKADTESLARFLFERLDTKDVKWEDAGISDFWMDEARALMRFLP